MLAFPGTGLAARYHIGLERDADPAAVRAAVEQATGNHPTGFGGARVLAVEAHAGQLDGIAGIAWVDRARERRLAFAPNDPLAARQWYAIANRAYDAWATPPPLAPVRVAVIDSGIDLGHPDLERRIAGSKSFVGGTAQDTRGHGTIVAGVIAAELDNATGIAGLAPSAELLIAKVVAPGGTISVDAEWKAIHWAVDNGARVINISLGGLRDPRNPDRDTFSRLEEEAIAYAVRKGAVVVAAVGNADQAPDSPWRFASYPAALPHVLGVSALTRSGSSPSFSNRDAVYNDVAAPGEDIFSTFPRALTAERTGCAEQGYTPCASDDFRPPEGTSFAAPQATASPPISSASGLFCDRSRSRASSSGRRRLERVDGVRRVRARARPRTRGGSAGRDGGDRGARRRDPSSGRARAERRRGRGRLPPLLPCGREGALREGVARLLGRPGRCLCGLPSPGREALRIARSRPAEQRRPRRVAPGRPSVSDLARQELRVTLSDRPGRRERLGWRAREDGWHFLQARLTEATESPVAYRLSVVRTH